MGCVRGPEQGVEGVEGGVALRGDPSTVGDDAEMSGVSMGRTRHLKPSAVFYSLVTVWSEYHSEQE